MLRAGFAFRVRVVEQRDSPPRVRAGDGRDLVGLLGGDLVAAESEGGVKQRVEPHHVVWSYDDE